MSFLIVTTIISDLIVNLTKMCKAFMEKMI